MTIDINAQLIQYDFLSETMLNLRDKQYILTASQMKDLQEVMPPL